MSKARPSCRSTDNADGDNAMKRRQNSDETKEPRDLRIVTRKPNDVARTEQRDRPFVETCADHSQPETGKDCQAGKSRDFEKQNDERAEHRRHSRPSSAKECLTQSKRDSAFGFRPISRPEGEKVRRWQENVFQNLDDGIPSRDVDILRSTRKTAGADLHKVARIESGGSSISFRAAFPLVCGSEGRSSKVSDVYFIVKDLRKDTEFATAEKTNDGSKPDGNDPQPCERIEYMHKTVYQNTEDENVANVGHSEETKAELQSPVEEVVGSKPSQSSENSGTSDILPNPLAVICHRRKRHSPERKNKATSAERLINVREGSSHEIKAKETIDEKQWKPDVGRQERNAPKMSQRGCKEVGFPSEKSCQTDKSQYCECGQHPGNSPKERKWQNRCDKKQPESKAPKISPKSRQVQTMKNASQDRVQFEDKETEDVAKHRPKSKHQASQATYDLVNESVNEMGYTIRESNTLPVNEQYTQTSNKRTAEEGDADLKTSEKNQARRSQNVERQTTANKTSDGPEETGVHRVNSVGREPRPTDESDSESLDSKSRLLLHQLEMVQICKRKANVLLKHVQSIIDGSQMPGGGQVSNAPDGKEGQCAAVNQASKDRLKSGSRSRETSVKESPSRPSKKQNTSMAESRADKDTETPGKSRKQPPEKEAKADSSRFWNSTDASRRNVSMAESSDYKNRTWENRKDDIVIKTTEMPELITSFRKMTDQEKLTPMYEKTKCSYNVDIQRRLTSSRKPFPNSCYETRLRSEESPTCCADSSVERKNWTFRDTTIKKVLTRDTGSVRGSSGKDYSLQKHGGYGYVPLEVSTIERVRSSTSCYEIRSYTSASLDSVLACTEGCLSKYRSSKDLCDKDDDLCLLIPCRCKQMNKRSFSANPQYSRRRRDSKSDKSGDFRYGKSEISKSSMRHSLKDAIRSARESLSAAAKVAEALCYVVKASTDSSTSQHSEEDRYLTTNEGPRMRSLEPRNSEAITKLQVKAPKYSYQGQEYRHQQEQRNLYLGRQYRHADESLDRSSRRKRPLSCQCRLHNESHITKPAFDYASILKKDSSGLYPKYVASDESLHTASAKVPASGYTQGSRMQTDLKPKTQDDTKHLPLGNVRAKSAGNLSDLSPEMTAESPHIMVQITISKSPETSLKHNTNGSLDFAAKEAEQQGHEKRHLRSDFAYPTHRKNARPKIDESSELTLSKEEWTVSHSCCSVIRKTSSYLDDTITVNDPPTKKTSARQSLHGQICGSCREGGVSYREGGVSCREGGVSCREGGVSCREGGVSYREGGIRNNQSESFKYNANYNKSSHCKTYPNDLCKSILKQKPSRTNPKITKSLNKELYQFQNINKHSASHHSDAFKTEPGSTYNESLQSGCADLTYQHSNAALNSTGNHCLGGIPHGHYPVWLENLCGFDKCCAPYSCGSEDLNQMGNCFQSSDKTNTSSNFVSSGCNADQWLSENDAIYAEEMSPFSVNCTSLDGSCAYRRADIETIISSNNGRSADQSNLDQQAYYEKILQNFEDDQMMSRLGYRHLVSESEEGLPPTLSECSSPYSSCGQFTNNGGEMSFDVATDAETFSPNGNPWQHVSRCGQVIQQQSDSQGDSA